METALAIGASVVTIVGGLYAVVRFVRARHRVEASSSAAEGGARAVLERRRRPLELEILPQHFELVLDGDVPEIRVYLFAVNYRKVQVTLSTLRVDQFRLSVGTVLDGIALAQELTLDAQRSRSVMCRRALLDSEARSFLKGPADPRPNASVTLSGRALSGRKTVEYGPHAGISVNGYVSRPSGGT